jgi:beta-galactosidase
LDSNLNSFNVYGFRKCGDSVGASERFYEYNNWEKINLPHDWAIKLPKDLRADTNLGGRNHTHYHSLTTENKSNVENVYNVGWYRKSFVCDSEWKDKRIFVEFEGIFRDATLWVNGVYMDTHTSGYTGFLVEITDQLIFDQTNSIAVRVDSDQAEGWWYEGAGIYRHVRLYAKDKVHIAHNGIFGKPVLKKGTKNSWNVEVETTLENSLSEGASASVRAAIYDGDALIAEHTAENISLDFDSQKAVFQKLPVSRPTRWDIDNPKLYTLKVEVIRGGEVIDSETARIGFRTFSIDAEKGFFLNGRPLKIKGTCNHQDHAGVGVAVPDSVGCVPVSACGVPAPTILPPIARRVFFFGMVSPSPVKPSEPASA